jgi:hypothetical protein
MLAALGPSGGHDRGPGELRTAHFASTAPSHVKLRVTTSGGEDTHRVAAARVVLDWEGASP